MGIRLLGAILPDDEGIDSKQPPQPPSDRLGLLFGLIVAHLDAKECTPHPVRAHNSGIVMGDFELSQHRPRPIQFGKRPNLDPKRSFLPTEGHNSQFDFVRSRSHHIQGLGTGVGQIQHPPPGEGPPIVDSDRHRTVITQGSHDGYRPQRECLVRGSQLVHVVDFAAGRLISVKSWSIPRGHTLLNEANRITRRIGDLLRASGSTSIQDKKREEEEHPGYQERIYSNRKELRTGLLRHHGWAS